MSGLSCCIEKYNQRSLEPGEPPMTVRRLAEVSRVPERTVYRHYRGETSIKLAHALAYARVLRCRIEDLQVEDAA